MRKLTVLLSVVAFGACDSDSPPDLLRPDDPLLSISHADIDCPNCGEREPTESERSSIQDMINWNISDDCPEMKSKLQELLDDHRILIYDQAPPWATTKYYPDGLYQGYRVFIHADHWNRSSGIPIPDWEELGDTMVHEGAHLDEHMKWGTFSNHDPYWADRKVECYEN